MSDPTSFGTYDEALQALQNGYNGIGILIAGGISAIDLDHVHDDQGKLSPWVDDIIRTMGCYTEVSPSGNGYRLLFQVSPGFTMDTGKYYINNQSIGVEVYINGATTKYVSVTGNMITPPDIGLVERTEQLKIVLDKYMQRPSSAAAPAVTAQPLPQAAQPQLPDDQLIQQIRNSRSGPTFDKLYSGDMSAYNGDHSSADLAFCNILATFTKDAAQIDRIFRTSKLMRAKWDSVRGNGTYGSMTIENSIRSAVQYAAAQAFAQTAPQRPAVRTYPVIPPMAAISAAALMEMDFPETQYFVEGLIPEGTGLLCGVQKFGKSWLVLWLAQSVASGTKFLNRNTTPCGVLYLTLEDSYKRLKGRLKLLLQGEPISKNLYLQTEAPTLKEGLLDILRDKIEQHPDIRLVVIDTLQTVRGAGSAEYSYSNDYSDVRTLKKFGDENHVSFLLVHHTRKNSDDADPFNRISGTMGLSGAADYAIVLDRERGKREATLYLTGRDVVESELLLSLDEKTMRWQTLGDAAAIRAEREKQEFLDNPIIRTVSELVDSAPSKLWSGKSSDIVKAAQAQCRDVGTASQVGIYLTANLDKFLTFLGIVTNVIPNGNAGRTYTFQLVQAGNIGAEDLEITNRDIA